ncbi:MAG: hypothetical protein EZS28_055741, partial [Streblomastix strix]
KRMMYAELQQLGLLTDEECTFCPNVKKDVVGAQQRAGGAEVVVIAIKETNNNQQQEQQEQEQNKANLPNNNNQESMRQSPLFDQNKEDNTVI